MDSSKGILEFSTSQLQDHCATERRKFRQGQQVISTHCFELFRRAFAKRDNAAWDAIHNDFLDQVERWIRKHPANVQANEEVQYFSNRAFEKMWVSVPPEKFNRFTNLASLLAYLKTCVASVVIDYQRKNSASQIHVEEFEMQDYQSQAQLMEEVVLEKSESNELWKLCKKLMNSKQEEIVLFSSFTLVMKPREILDQYPEQFADIDQVYRTKENILSRLRRSPDLTKLIGKPEEKS